MWVLPGQRDPWEMLDTTGPWGRQGQPEPLVRNEEKVVWGISESGSHWSEMRRRSFGGYRSPEQQVLEAEMERKDPLE